LIGQTIGHYEVIEKLGEGGMGAVYKARDIHLGRSVAIKVLPGGSVANPERKRRFALEAKAASALNHNNIVTIYDIDETDGVDFIAMEHVAGHTLEELIPPGGMEPARAIQFGAQIAEASAAAHQFGIVHRDLKPSNIMVIGMLFDELVHARDQNSRNCAPQLTATPGQSPTLVAAKGPR
jgi:serine/threonine protein kinase